MEAGQADKVQDHTRVVLGMRVQVLGILTKLAGEHRQSRLTLVLLLPETEFSERQLRIETVLRCE
jgi:hypothetical protein